MTAGAELGPGPSGGSGSGGGSGVVTLVDEHAGTAPRPEPGPLPPLDVARYVLHGEVGRGGIGTVLRATDIKLGRDVALKLLVATSDDGHARFVREATITSRLHHPSIIAVHDFGLWADSVPGYTMPLYGGRSLRSAIEAAGDLAARLALVPHVLAVAEAMAYAHAQRVVHRDLKPSNVLLGEFGQTVVIDWGLAKRLEGGGVTDVDTPMATRAASLALATPLADPDATHLGAVIGTPAYMAPEQARGEPADERADVYALGATLYHVLSGRAPYAGQGSSSVVAQVLAGPPPPVDRVQPGTPDELDAIVEKAMAREPAARYATAAAFAEDLSRYLTGRLVAAYAYTRAERVRRWLHQHRAVARVLVAAAVVLAVGAALSVVRISAAGRRARAAAAAATARGDALVLTQAESALATDPTRALTWLKAYPDAGADWARARRLADDAASRGRAEHVLRRAQSQGSNVLVAPGGRRVTLPDGITAMRAWDLDLRTTWATCTPSERVHWPVDQSDAGESPAALEDGQVVVWSADLRGWELVARLPDAETASISSDGRLVAYGSRQEARVFDRETGADVRVLEGEDVGPELRFVPGTHWLAARTGLGHLLVVDVDRGTWVYAGAPGVTGRWFVATRSHHVVFGRGDSYTWLALDDGKLAHAAVRLGFFYPVDFFADGRVAIHVQKIGLHLWDPRSGKPPQGTPFLLTGGPVAISPDDRFVATSIQDRQVRVWEPATGDLYFLDGHEVTALVQLRFLDAGHLLSVSEDHSIRVWALEPGRARIVRLADRDVAPSFAVDDAGRIVAARADGGVVYIDAATGAESPLGRAPAPVLALAITRDGRTVIGTDAQGKLRRWPGPSADVDLPAATHAPGVVVGEGASRFPVRLVVSDDGQRAGLAAYHDHVVQAWDLTTGQGGALEAPRGEKTRVAFAADQRRLLVEGGALGAEVSIYDFATGQLTSLAHDGHSVDAYGWSASGEAVWGASPDGVVVRWHPRAGTRATYPLHAASVTGGVPLGERFLLTGDKLGELKVWAPELGVAAGFGEAGRGIGELWGSPDGRFVAAGLTDWSLAVFDLHTGERRMLRGHDHVITHAAFLPDGRVVSASRDGTLRLWAAPAPWPATPAATRTWLDALTSARLGDERRAFEACR